MHFRQYGSLRVNPNQNLEEAPVKRLTTLIAPIIVLLCGLTVFAPSAAAGVVYVGSWAPYNTKAPGWYGHSPNGPLAYTAQEAAALLFGGIPSDYSISTIDSNPANINNQAWYDVIGFGANVFSESYNNKYLHLYYGPTSGYDRSGGAYNNAASAFVRDNEVTGLNYAFKGQVPEPGTWFMMVGSFGLMAVSRRIAKRKARG